ncbi:MAG: polymer-forming cytoskeletal protein [Gemmatimonadales bacterium]
MAIFSGEKREGGEHPRRRATDQMPLSIVAHDLVVTGDLIADGVVKVEGRVKGNIRAGNQILIAPGATIEGDLHTKEAVIGGDVRGVIHAGERVELQATAVVEGDIHTPRIAILEGARVTGEVKMDAVVAQPA